jgi:hypothetical protein
MDNLVYPVEERFEKFLLKYPTLLQKVPIKQIVSYHATPCVLSKMK